MSIRFRPHLLQAPLAVTLALLLGASCPLAAQQVDSAIIVGTIRDASDALVANAIVDLTHLATGAKFRVLSDENGQYRTPPLRIGEYELGVEAPGFKRVSQKGIALSVADVRRVDFRLEVGQLTETVEVEASVPLLQTAESSTGTVIGNRQIVDLPLNGRDYLQLAAISSGTVPSRGQGVSVGGQRGTEVNFLIDGIDNNNQSIASQGNQKESVKPAIDAVAEFKVVTNGFAAEYGRSSAGVVNLTLKSGTNNFHGTVYEFLRNEALDARNFFTPVTSPKPRFRRNQYGFAAGGPVVRNKAFLFGDLELTDVRESSTNVSTVPGLAERTGDFTGRNLIYDPLTFNGTSRQPFANNRVPVARIDPVSARITEWWPTPQLARATNNYTYIAPRNQDYRKWDVRYDQILGAKDNLFYRFSTQTQDVPASPQLPDASIGNVSRPAGNKVDSYNTALVYNRIWSASVVTSIRGGWNYLYTSIAAPNDRDLNSAIGLKGVDQTLPGSAEIEVAGFRGVGTSNFNPNLINSQTRQLSGDTTITRNRHSIKFGASAYWLQSHIVNPQRAKGRFEFDNRFTENPGVATNKGGEAFADFLLGASHTGFGSSFVYMNLRAPFTAYYLQDDWRVNDRLTLNLGVRYEINPPWVETRNLIANYDIDTNPASPRLVVAGADGSDRYGRGLQSTDYTNVAPRFGFAYSVTPSTVVRGAYGIFYGNVSNTGGGEFLETNPPFHLKASITTDRNNPTLFLRDGLPAGAVSPQNAQGLRLSSFERNVQWPIAQQWNLNVQHSLPDDILLEVGYFGNKMNHIVRRYDGNYAPPGPGDINARRRYPTVLIPGTNSVVSQSELNRFQYDGNTLYHGLQAKLEKRYSQGLTFIASYAWSKTISDIGGIPGSGNAPGEDWRVQDPLNFRAERSLATQHMPHRFVGSYVYELPFGKGKPYGSSLHPVLDAAVGGWSVGGIVTLASGMPMNLTVQGQPSNTGSGQSDRPDVVGQWQLDDSQRTLDRYFNTGAFVRNQAFRYGNAGRNILLGPGTVAWDFSAFKTFLFTERFNAQFRCESFNFTNTPVFGAPNTEVGNRNFGVISSAGNPRNMQLGLKVNF